ncbi:uncharacterized protein [Littorina saxatilis]|uniref:uncharacterized protein n=1 Tax=Littorina saxatilis TaxID=31220 RepID=UPI0038B57C12
MRVESVNNNVTYHPSLAAFIRSMSVVCLLSLIYFLHIAHGYTISECGSDGTLDVTDTQNVTLTCTGITDDDMFWAFTPPNRRGRSIAACVWFSSSCKVTNSVYEVSRTQYNTSTLTVKRNTRDSIAGLVKCVPEGNNLIRVASCTLRVIATKETTAVYGSTTPKIPTATTVPPILDVTSDKTTERYNTNNDDDDNDDESNHTLVISGVVAAAVFAVTIAVVTAIVVWKKICVPTYARPTRRSQVINSNIYSELDLQQENSIYEAPEEHDYENTTGQQPAGPDTVEYVNTATGTQAAQGTVYMNV